mgnify:CR=1 FL=1
MITLYDSKSLAAILNRIENLQPNAERQWGKMNVSQMLAHCSATMEMANGSNVHKRLFIGYVLGPVFKSNYLSDKPFGKDSPTSPHFVIVDEREFQKEKGQLMKLVKGFGEAGQEKCTTHPHGFFGKLTPEQWGKVMFKHLDHHLRQFNA